MYESYNDNGTHGAWGVAILEHCSAWCISMINYTSGQKIDSFRKEKITISDEGAPNVLQ